MNLDAPPALDVDAAFTELVACFDDVRALTVRQPLWGVVA